VVVGLAFDWLRWECHNLIRCKLKCAGMQKRAKVSVLLYVRRSVPVASRSYAAKKRQTVAARVIVSVTGDFTREGARCLRPGPERHNSCLVRKVENVLASEHP
jgi:hypothetical protein